MIAKVPTLANWAGIPHAANNSSFTGITVRVTWLWPWMLAMTLPGGGGGGTDNTEEHTDTDTRQSTADTAADNTETDTMEPLDLSWTVKQEVTSDQIADIITCDRPWNLSLPRRHSTSDSDRSYTTPTPSSDYQDTSDGEGAASPKLAEEMVVSEPYCHRTKRFLHKYISQSQMVNTQDLITYG